MPSLSRRVAARGYAQGAVAGLTNVQGEKEFEALRRPRMTPIDFATPQSTLIGFDPEGPPPPDYELNDLLDHGMGLPGELADPLRSPGYGPGNIRTHAAPRPGWAGSYRPATPEIAEEIDVLHANSREIHHDDFGMPAHLTNVLADNVAQQPADHWDANVTDGGMGTGQAQLSGAQRSLGYLQKDALQGYDRRNRYGFDAGHRWRDSYPGYQDKATGQPLIYIDPAERPFIVPQAQGSFTPTDAVQGPGPWISDLHAENVSYNAPTAYQAPPEPATLAAPLVEAPVGWGH